MDETKGDAVLWGPYNLRPIHEHLVKVSTPKDKSYGGRTGVALYDHGDRAAFVATDGFRALAWPIEKVKDGKSEPVQTFMPKVAGPIRAIVPLQAFAHLPTRVVGNEFGSFADEQRNALVVALRIERRGERVVTVIEWDESDGIKVRRIYDVWPKDDFPDVTAMWLSRLPANKPFDRDGGVISLDPEILLELAKALGSPGGVRLHIRASDKAIYVEGCNVASKHGAGALLMPINPAEEDGYNPAREGAEPTVRRAPGIATPAA